MPRKYLSQLSAGAGFAELIWWTVLRSMMTICTSLFTHAPTLRLQQLGC
jgi:hypothetical protein